MARHRSDIIVMDADLLSDCGIEAFQAELPGRFIECGIAEQHMVSAAGGMALGGMLPIVHSFACFLSTRANEHIYNNATERTKVVYVASLAGLLPAGPGHSHQSVRDISALGGVPDLIMIEPSTEDETEDALDFCVNTTPSSCYIRLVSIPAEIPYALPADHRLSLGRGVVLREGRDAALIGYGPVLLTQAYRAAELLAREAALEVAVIDLPWLNRVDRDWLADVAGRYPWLFTLDNHYLHGGQGQMILAALAELPGRPLPRTRRLGVTRIPLCGGNIEVLEAHGLDAAGIAEQVRRALAGEG